ncbi:hypothetical protein BCR39DRAFT_553546 [Naematelia encephala]|uniref:Coilin n=1 Tax=Naematelia encephala TaxID=71784 RepID=A0A1Y2AG36_9TREE|nr:hypothetical protein BCR39DRAFT_553546 [Naematelia encephala]
MSVKRVRIALSAPFTPSKYLLPLPEPVKTISDLKRHLVKSLSTVAHLVKNGRELVLEVDGFELLGGSEVAILREDDIVSVALAAGSSKSRAAEERTTTKKRKLSIHATDKETSTGKKKKRKEKPISAPIETPKASTTPKPAAAPLQTASRARASSSSSSSSASSSSTSSSSVVSSSTSSTSSSSSSSTTSSSSGPSVHKPKPSTSSSSFPVLSKPLPPVQPPIPPGHGKSSTHDRNLRRRRARQLQKALAEAAAARDSINEATFPLQDVYHGTIVPANSELPVPKDMSNRNKKKGFLEEMKAVQPTRTIFNESEQLLIPNGNAESQTNGTHLDSTPIRHNVVPPSQTDLPSNMFVTSKEFRKPMGGWKQLDGIAAVADLEDVAGFDEDGYSDWFEETNGASHSSDPVLELWAEAEKGIDGFEFLGSSNVISVKEGDHLAWKELELDLTTFSPILAVKLARITSITESHIKAEKLTKPVDPDFLEANATAPVEEGEKNIAISIGDLGEASQYRIVRF